MKNMFKRILSLVMVLVLAGSMLPVSHVHGEGTETSGILADEDYAIVNDVFAQIDAMEDAPAKKSATQTQLTDAAIKIVEASENYVEGSLERNGNTFTWWTEEGIRCIYDPRMREKHDNMVAPADPEPSGIYNEPMATKGGWPSSNQVYLIAPYYGMDESFTDQYKNEATAIASAIGDTDGYTLCSGSAVTVDDVATAISNGAVVIFDSHGTTDYTNPNDEYDFVTGANYSYLCLTNNSGLTTEDYNAGATYFIDSDGYMCACINGAAIANHMTKNSPSGILWMAICLGMATDTMCQPMRDMGVEVVYGYSQSVFFDTEYIWEERFWDNMCAGKDVATSVADMKAQCGSWELSEEMYNYANWAEDEYGPVTMQEARDYYYAFPVVVSDEDAYPGQRSSSSYGADSLQTVKSTYTLFSKYEVTAQSSNTSYGTVTASGNTITAVPATGYFAESATVVSGTATVTQNGNTFSVLAESDCTVQINFAPKTAVTVNFSGANVSGLTGYAGDSMTLPTAEAPEGYSFLGWTTAPLSSETTEKPSYYTDSFIPTGDSTLYALYSYVDENFDSGSGDYVKVTSTPDDWSGEYLIVYENGANAYIFNSVDASNGYLSATISDNTIESNATTDAEAVTIEAMTGGYAIKSKNGYIYGSSGSNKLNFNTSTQQLNTLNLAADGTVLVTSNTSVLRFNATSGQYRFRYYKAASYEDQEGVSLYLKDGSAGTTYYVSALCDHANVVDVAEVAPSCTETGFSAGTQCTDCGSYITGHEVVAALGHTVSDGACTVCGEAVDTSILKTGDQVVIFAPAYNKALSADKVATYYNKGVDITVSGDTVTGYTDAEVWTVTDNGDGTYSFANDGQNIGLAVSYSSMNLGEVYDKWNVIALGGSLYNIQNVDRSNYMEWYAEKDNWSTYNTADAATNDLFQLSFYVIGQGILGAEVIEPETTEPTEPSEPETSEPEATESETVDPATCEHDYGEWVVIKLPTFTASGQQEKTCSICGKVVTQAIMPAVATVEKWNISLVDDLMVNFHLLVSSSIESTAKVKISLADDTITYNIKDLPMTDEGLYVVSVELAAAQMADDIVIFIVDKNQIGCYANYTIRQYADTVLADESLSGYHALVREMLNYGAAAQSYFGYSVDSLANEGITGAGAAEIPEVAGEAVQITGDAEGVSFYAASLLYREKIAIRFYFRFSGDINTCTFAVNGEKLTPGLKSGLFYVDVTGITPEMLDQQVELTVTDGSGNTLVIGYSPINYIVRMNQKGSESLKVLLKALYNYHLAANDFKTA